MDGFVYSLFSWVPFLSKIGQTAFYLGKEKQLYTLEWRFNMTPCNGGWVGNMFEIIITHTCTWIVIQNTCFVKSLWRRFTTHAIVKSISQLLLFAKRLHAVRDNEILVKDLSVKSIIFWSKYYFELGLLNENLDTWLCYWAAPTVMVRTRASPWKRARIWNSYPLNFFLRWIFCHSQFCCFFPQFSSSLVNLDPNVGNHFHQSLFGRIQHQFNVFLVAWVVYLQNIKEKKGWTGSISVLRLT